MRENVRLFFIVYSCVNIVYTVAVQYRGIVAKNQKFQAWKKLCYLAFSSILWYNGPIEVYNEKFRMTPIHYWMVGLLAFIILSITSRLFGGTLANLVVLF